MKNIPIALRNDQAQDATSWCILLHVLCKDGTVLGFTNLDADVAYDAGGGEVVYRADNGFTPSRLQMSADAQVDNAEFEGWIQNTGITEQQIRAGLFDFGRVRGYRVNYLDLSHGHEILLRGTLGETRFNETGWVTEFRSLTQQLMQDTGARYSLTCRAKFGSTYADEKYPCTKPLTWVSGSVTDVDPVEPRRVFTAAGLSEPDDHFRYGVLLWTSGANAGQSVEVETNTAGEVQLVFDLPYAIEDGDEFDIRQDCDKTFEYCDEVHDNHLFFRGEHLIRLADAANVMVPGANITRVAS
ncbi:DUF2163 domain-containing protein [Lysobacter sp. Root96]|uniref:DUF2163 domain-containing protein n=1 Tax=Lysobacter sp. Root96 TaxID=1736612 RepID=UPI0007154B80|nr:DUF2163 domain-containing protein [Lysobacter sp. Root96]KRD71454.1 hypothetical protein ASE45_06495 [Lysobacter sp. Root96]